MKHCLGKEYSNPTVHNESSKTNSYRHLTNEFLTSPWCYGLSNVFKSKNIIKRLIWAICFLVALITCAIAMKENLNSFISYHVISQVKISYHDEIIFPQVTICKYQDSFNQSQIDLCSFDNKINCTDSLSLIKVYNLEGAFSNCLQFNNGQLVDVFKQTTGHNIIGGLRLNVTFSYLTNSANLLYIGNKFEKPLYAAPDAIFSDGESVSIILEQTTEENLNKPYSDCLKESDIYKLEDSHLAKKTIAFNHRYQKSKCYFLCKFKYFAEKYNCTYPQLYDIDSSIKCIDTKENRAFHYTSYFSFETHCSESCPLECDKTRYSISMTRIDKLPYISNKSFQLTMNYYDLKSTMIKQVPAMSGWDLTSKLGGLLGLFVGFKILSFVDILQFGLEMMVLTFKKLTG